MIYDLSSHPSESVLADLEGFKAQLESNFVSLKKASATARMHIENSVKNQLMSRPVVNSPQSKKGKGDKKALSQKSAGLTEDLLRVSRVFASHVKMNEAALDTLVASSATVTETQEDFKQMGSYLSQSRKLLSKYGRREFTDKVFILLALAFYFACCMYVTTKRLF